ncbi:MAG: hypothetical protein AAGA48_02615 [Myxococcota bacterium]
MHEPLTDNENRRWTLGAEGRSAQAILGDVLAVAQALAAAPRPHGRLRPTHVLMEPQGVVLTDWSAEGARVVDDTRWLVRWLAEALCEHPVADIEDPDGQRAVRDTIAHRLRTEGNLAPRFVDRVADRLGTLTGRALAAQQEPSPPFRFHTWAPVVERLTMVLALFDPQVVDVGPLVWSRGVPTFGTDEGAVFTVRVECTPGIDEVDDLICGLKVETETRRVPVPGASVKVKVEDGRLRFRLQLPPLPAGAYRVTAAFAVQGSGAVPQTSHADLIVDGPEPLATPLGQDRATLVPEPTDEAFLSAVGELPDPRLGIEQEELSETSEAAPSHVSLGSTSSDEGTFPKEGQDPTIARSTADASVVWGLGLSAALAALAVLSYVARSW